MKRMCGIAGLARSSLPAGESARALERMTASLRHRGPDAVGVVWHETQRVGLGHRRLAILDASDAGAQPMVSAHGRHVVVLNGEICNAPALARRLRDEGVQFRGHSDTEVALAAIDTWGLQAALDQLAGMFALAVHDQVDGALHLVRDRLGVKPLHFTWIGGEGIGMLAFASEVRALLEVPGFVRRVDAAALAGFFAHGCTPGPSTIWQGVHSVPPGCHLRVDLASGATRLHRYWNPVELAASAAARAETRPDAAWIDEADALLTQVVDENLLADAPVACFLSGGVDSSLVATLARARQPSLQAFTVASTDAELDESVAAARTAALLGLRHHVHRMQPTEVLPLAQRLSTVHDEPFADSSALATLQLAECARAAGPVALAGDGGDEVFGGYNRHRMAASLWPASRRLPRVLRAMVSTGLQMMGSDAMAWMLPRSRLGPRPGDRLRKLARVFDATTEAQAYEAITSIWQPVPVTGVTPNQTWWQPDAAARLPDFLSRMQAMDLSGYLVDDALVKVDRASMAVGLEVRVPLLDHRLVEFAWRLPTRLRVRDGCGKWLLRQVLARRVPGLRLASAKAGFAVPLADWLRGPLRAWAADLLSRQAFRQHPLIHHAAMSDCWQRLLAGDDAQADRAWTCITFSAWSAQWERES